MASWMRNAIHQAVKPTASVIGVLKQHLGGSKPGRSMAVLHASDVTKLDFCPRKWAFFDLFEKQPPMEVISAALEVTFQMGYAAETLMVEEWGGDAVVGNWQCRYCKESRTMTTHPGGCCKDGRKHWWQYRQMVVEDPTTGIQGGIDALFNLGTPQLVVTEIKTLNPTEFETIVLPQPEHRLRTSLYLRIIDQSNHPYRSKINTQEARVVYISRGYGKLHAAWNEILPFKEFVVVRQDSDLAEPLQRASALRTFRTAGLMPAGICATALDKAAKACSVCAACFSGEYPAGKYPPSAP